MFSLKIVTETTIPYKQKTIDDIARTISKIVSKPQKWTLNIVFVDANSIKDLNNSYRKKDSVTDVLSFHYFDDFSGLQKSDIAGEIVLCEEVLKKQAIEYWLGEEKEFYKLVIHSVLHILGYDHETDEEYEEMKIVEEEVWEGIISPPYQ
jgi:probable rRNA maturation factor